MNRILCIIVAVSLCLSISVPTFSASDYDGHWAKNIIDSLLSDKVISGDGENIRPNDNIRRSEFVTIINNAFSYTSEGATVNFPDVSADKWYFTQFLAAKKAGYLTGDQNGNVNPEKNITRAEVAVILSRVLNFKSSGTKSTFADDKNIPSWSKDAIYALAEEGVINGYPDGSFKAENAMTRAEAFSVIYNVKNLNTPSENNGNSTSDRINMTTESVGAGGSSSGGGSGGGGGGGGGSAGAVYEDFKITREDSENYIVAWTPLNNVYVYNVKVTSKRTGASLEEQVTSTAFVYKTLADRLTESGRKSKEEFDVLITAASSGGTKVCAASVSVEYLCVPDVNDVITYCEPENGMEKIYLSFTVSDKASSYELKFDYGSGLENLPYTIVNGKAVADITNVLSIEDKDEFSYSVKGISSDSSNILDSETVTGEVSKPLYFSGSGTESDPYIIKNVRHFVNIEKNNGAHFILAEDIVLPSTYVPFEFNGVLKGDNTTDYRSITVDITGPSGANIGLFTQASAQGTTVMYIALKGKVKGSGKYVGGFFGAFTIAGNLSYCINYADIESSGDRTGGFTGKSSIEGALNHLINYGNVKTSNGAGGIAGESHGGSYLANLGNVSGGWYVGGIFGVSTTSVTASFNKGDISGAFNVGGIVGCGSGSGKKITACYNVGNVSQSMAKYDTNQAGGILGGVASTSATYNLTSCYSTGTVTAASGAYLPIYPTYSSPANMTASDCVYVSETGEDDGLTGTESVTSEELKTYIFKTDMLAENAVTSYPYPEIADFPDIVIPKVLSTPVITSVEADRTSCNVNIKGQAETSSYELLISKNADYSSAVSLSVEGGSMKTVDIFSYLADYDTYYVKVTAKGNGIEWLDSASVETTCSKPVYKLSTPSAVVSRPESNLILLNITGQAETIEYKVAISVNPDFSDASLLSISGGNAAEYEITDYITDTGVKYYISVKAIGDESDWLSSDEFITEYTKEVYKLAVPELKENPYFDNTGYVIEWETIGSSNYDGMAVEVKDSENNTVYSCDVDKEETSFILSEDSAMPFGENTYTVSIYAKALMAEENSPALTFAIDTRFGGGFGTVSEPYFICNTEHFKNIALENTAHFALRADIDLTDCGYTPIGEFYGTLSGYNNEMKTVSVAITSNGTNVGLFAKAENASLSYIALDGSVTSTKTNALSQTGGFVANASETVRFSNCVNNALITAVKNNAGGFVGKGVTVVIDNCVNNGDISIPSGSGVGGFVGKATTVYNNNSVNNGSITGNSNTGDIAGSGSVVTGLAKVLITPDENIRRMTV